MKDAKRLEKRKQEENHEMIKTENKQIYQRKTKNIFLKKILFFNKKKERGGGGGVKMPHIRKINICVR